MNLFNFTVTSNTLKNMINRAEKLSLLSEMIAFAQTDENIKTIEYNFLFSIARQLDISKEDFEYLFEHPVTYVHLKTHRKNRSVSQVSITYELRS